MRRKFWIALTLAFLAGCKRQEVGLLKIAEVKKMRSSRVKTDPSLLLEHDVEGYYYNDPLPMLVTDLRWVQVNTPKPDSVYILLTGDQLKAVQALGDSLIGKKIRIRGKIVTEEQHGFAPEKRDFILTEKPKIISSKPTKLRPRYYKPVSRLHAQLFAPSPDYALLYAGGDLPGNNDIRYWNDLVLAYTSLLGAGFQSGHIIVVYADGHKRVDAPYPMPVNYPATTAGLNNAINQLAKVVTTRCKLLIFLSNHGGGFCQSKAQNESGILSNRPGRTLIGGKHYDATLFYYQQLNNEVSCFDFGPKLKQIPFGQLIFIAEQCFGGGFVYDVRGQNRIFISASSEYGESFGDDSDLFDEFAEYMVAGLVGTDSDNKNIRNIIDTNHDGKISVLEAFLYAKKSDHKLETPLLEDLGQGLGTGVPSGIPGSEGSLASKVSIN